MLWPVGALKHLETIVTDTGVLEFPEEAMEDEALEAAVQTMILGTSTNGWNLPKL